MKISEILTEPLVLPQIEARDKEGTMGELARHLCQHADSSPFAAEEINRALLDRERLGSTGVGEGVAIPHAKISGLRKLVACFGRSQSGIPFDAIDQQPVKLFFVLLVPENSAGAHLKALARISRLLKNASFRERLLALPDRSAIFDAFIEEDGNH